MSAKNGMHRCFKMFPDLHISRFSDQVLVCHCRQKVGKAESLARTLSADLLAQEMLVLTEHQKKEKTPWSATSAYFN